MNSLTNKERERIFAMYYGAEMLSSFKEPFKVNGDIIQDISSVWPMHNVAKILLIPLSKITDEHAIEVANLWNKGYGWEINTRVQFYLELVNKTTYQIIRIWFTGSIDFQLIVGNETLFDNCEAIVEMIDKLRELGYALPYKGKSLFELGIAIDKTLV